MGDFLIDQTCKISDSEHIPDTCNFFIIAFSDHWTMETGDQRADHIYTYRYIHII